MRRTPLKRGKQPKRSTKPIKRRQKLRVKGKSRFPRRRNKAYREWLYELCCVLAGHPMHFCWGQTECCHLKSRGAGGDDVGNCWPGCAWAHVVQHDMGIKSFQKKYGIDLTAIAKDLGARWAREQETA